MLAKQGPIVARLNWDDALPGSTTSAPRSNRRPWRIALVLADKDVSAIARRRSRNWIGIEAEFASWILDATTEFYRVIFNERP